MKKKPLLFIILAGIHLIEPLFKLFYFKASTGFEWTVIFNNVFSINSPKAIFEFWFLFPIAGIALLTVKKWSYPIFVAAQAYSIFALLTYQKFTWPYVAETPFIGHTMLVVFNVLVIIYFALPEIRKPFFDASLRWWETPTRYFFEMPCSISFNDINSIEDVKIHNISRTGAFVAYSGPVNEGQPVKIRLTYGPYDLKLHAEVVRVNEFQGVRGIGLKFHFKTLLENITMRKMMILIDRQEPKHSLVPEETKAAA